MAKSAAPKADAPTIRNLTLRYAPRVTHELLGSQKYTTPAKAVAELVANAFDAGARTVKVTLDHDLVLGILTRVIIEDNGSGISPQTIEERIIVVGVAPPESSNPQRLGRFGVGRFAVHRVGNVSLWKTTARDGEGNKVQSSFQLIVDAKKLRVEQTQVARNAPTGTSITIEEVKKGQEAGLTVAKLSEELVSQFCGYLLSHPGKVIEVAGEPLDVQALIERQEVEELGTLGEGVGSVSMRHVLLRRPVGSRFKNQVILSGNGRTVKGIEYDGDLNGSYLGIGECGYLNKIATSNREGLIEFDSNLDEIAVLVSDGAKRFNDQLLAGRGRYIERARLSEYYPYRGVPATSIVATEQAMFDFVLDRINDSAKVEGMTKRQQGVIFRLLKRSLESEDMLAVLEEVASLSSEDTEKLRRVLERTTFTSIIKLASDVEARLHFLDVLHEIVYGDAAKHVRERSQLHKLLEPKAWLFGPRFNLATSDRAFREVIRRHREMADLPPVPPDDDLSVIPGIDNIPDLFLATRKDYPAEPKHHHLLVELKAPRVKLGNKELMQARSYATTILESPQFEKESTRWDVFLVSSEIGPELKHDRETESAPFGCIVNYPKVKVWAFTWSEVIADARDEMHAVRDHLERRSKELAVSDYLRAEFPGILDNFDELAKKDR